MGLSVKIINRLLVLMYKKTADSFFKGMQNLNDIEKTQEEILFKILQENSNTIYGKKHNFKCIKTIQDFKKNVPVTQYENYKNYIDEIANGKENVLTCDKIIMFELTGGSGGACKFIPYTKGLKNEFLQGIKPWIYSLYTTFPKVQNGRSYWSITPPTHEKKHTKGGVPIGFEDDSAYFGKIEQFLTDKIFVRAKNVKNERNMQKFYFKTCLCLLNASDLTLISVWNPSYLIILLDFINNNKQNLLDSLPKRRRNEIELAVNTKAYDKIWQNLCVISCWCDGQAQSTANELKALFPKVHIQPKGLLSTEAFMTLPYKNTGLCVLSYKSHYFEFIDVDTGEFFSYTQLKKGKMYEMIFTTSGGFYRYKINDAVLVADIDEKTAVPLLKFVGKTDKTSDYHGEKLNEIFIGEVLLKLENEEEFTSLNLKERFKLFAYESGNYNLFLHVKNSEILNDTAILNALEEKTEQLLCEAYHYKLCRELGQLKPLKIILIYGDVKQKYINYYLKKGKKLGDIKPELLSLNTNWVKAFCDELSPQKPIS